MHKKYFNDLNPYSPNKDMIVEYIFTKSLKLFYILVLYLAKIYHAVFGSINLDYKNSLISFSGISYFSSNIKAK